MRCLLLLIVFFLPLILSGKETKQRTRRQLKEVLCDSLIEVSLFILLYACSEI